MLFLSNCVQIVKKSLLFLIGNNYMLLDLISTSMDKNVLLQIDIYHASHKLRSDSLISTACFVSLNGCEFLFFSNARCQTAVFTMLPVTLPTSLFLVHLNLKHMFIVALRGEKNSPRPVL